MFRILVLDDSLRSRNLIRQSLATDGHFIFSTGSVKEAQQELSVGAFDLLILDINMPETDGFSFLSNLRNNRNLKDLRVVMVSSRNEQKDVERAAGLKVVGYILKPFTPQYLADKVNRVLTEQSTFSNDDYLQLLQAHRPKLTCSHLIEVVDTSELGIIVRTRVHFNESQKIKLTSSLNEFQHQNRLLQVLSSNIESNGTYLVTLFFAEEVSPGEPIMAWNLQPSS